MIVIPFSHYILAYTKFSKFKNTQDNLKIINTSVQEYFILHKRFPVPDEAVKLTVSTSQGDIEILYGFVPIEELSLSEALRSDGYGKLVSFVVPANLAEDGLKFYYDSTLQEIVADSGSEEKDDDIEVYLDIKKDDTVLSSDVAYVLISHGRDSVGSYRSINKLLPISPPEVLPQSGTRNEANSLYTSQGVFRTSGSFDYLKKPSISGDDQVMYHTMQDILKSIARKGGVDCDMDALERQIQDTEGNDLVSTNTNDDLVRYLFPRSEAGKYIFPETSLSDCKAYVTTPNVWSTPSAYCSKEGTWQSFTPLICSKISVNVSSKADMVDTSKITEGTVLLSNFEGNLKGALDFSQDIDGVITIGSSAPSMGVLNVGGSIVSSFDVIALEEEEDGGNLIMHSLKSKQDYSENLQALSDGEFAPNSVVALSEDGLGASMLEIVDSEDGVSEEATDRRVLTEKAIKNYIGSYVEGNSGVKIYPTFESAAGNQGLQKYGDLILINNTLYQVLKTTGSKNDYTYIGGMYAFSARESEIKGNSLFPAGNYLGKKALSWDSGAVFSANTARGWTKVSQINGLQQYSDVNDAVTNQQFQEDRTLMMIGRDLDIYYLNAKNGNFTDYNRIRNKRAKAFDASVYYRLGEFALHPETGDIIVSLYGTGPRAYEEARWKKINSQFWYSSSERGSYSKNALINHEGALYKNITGSNSNETPDIDSVNWEEFSAGGGGGGLSAIPVGGVIAYNGTTVPSGFKFCNGASLTSADYPEYFKLVTGAKYVSGTSASKVSVPDLRGRFIRGLDSGANIDSGRSLGSDQGFSTSISGLSIGSESNTHDHNAGIAISGNKIVHGGGYYRGSTKGRVASNASSYRRDYAITGGGRQSHKHTLSGGSTETRPRNVALNYIIRVLPISADGTVALTAEERQERLTEDLEANGTQTKIDDLQEQIDALNAINGTPVGAILAYYGTVAPEGFKFCRGGTVSSADNPAYFQARTGQDFVAGTSNATVSIPDLRGRFIRGLDSGANIDSGRSLGSDQGFSTSISGLSIGSESNTHDHNAGVAINGVGIVHGGGYYRGSTNGTVVNNASSHRRDYAITGGRRQSHKHTLSGGSPETRPRNVAFNYIIRISKPVAGNSGPAPLTPEEETEKFDEQLQASTDFTQQTDDIQGLRDEVEALRAMVEAGSQEAEGRIEIPIGAIIAYNGTVAPEGFVLCTGGIIRSAEYPELYKVQTGEEYTEDSTRLMRVPDLRGEFIRGVDPGRGRDSQSPRDPGTWQNAEQQVLSLRTGNAYPEHGHDIGVPGDEYLVAVSPADDTTAEAEGRAVRIRKVNYIGDSGEVGHTHSMGSGSENRPRNIAFHFIMRVK